MLNNILEISKRASKGGRVPIKIALLKIHEDPKETNKNGLHWKEEYVLNAIDSTKCMPICSAFSDETKTVPFDHGFTGEYVNEDGMKEPLFENSETVGVIESASIQNITIGDETIKALVGSGYLYNQRYKNFVSWVRKNYALSQVDTSIEIMGLEVNNNEIIYEEEQPTDEFRTPSQYLFSGVSILAIAPAEDTAIVLEVAQKKDQASKEEKIKMEFNMDEIKSVIKTTITELNNDKTAFETKITKLNSEIVSRDNKIKEFESTIESKNSEINTLTATIEQVQKALDDLKAEQETYWIERKTLEDELGKLKAEKRIAEMNKAISVYTNEERKFAESEINSFKENPLEGDIDAITSKICVSIVAKQKEANHVSETNARTNGVTVEDIFSEMYSEPDETEEDVNIF